MIKGAIKTFQGGKKMKTSLIYEKVLSGKGKLLIKEFMENFQGVFARDVCKYAKNTKKDIGLEHIFWYGEQRTKTIVTTTLHNVCKGYFMQESGVSRILDKSKSNELDYQKGKVDYWCRIGSATKISLLIEVKQGWIKYDSPDKWTLYQHAIDRHESAIKQIKNIKKSDFLGDNLYGIALTLLPLFAKYKSSDSKPIKISSEVLGKICSKTMKKTNSHACGSFIIPEGLQEISDWPKQDKTIYESYPGFIFVWYIYKCTRT